MTRTDVIIIGAGPAGLYAAFYVGLRGLTTRVIDARPEPGGQLIALYPEKFVYDAPGFPRIRAAELARRLTAQLATFEPRYALGETATALTCERDVWTVGTDRGTYEAAAVIVTAGIGALLPRAVTTPGAREFASVLSDVTRLDDWKGKRVLVYGGVPQATRAALALHDGGAQVLLAHRRALFRGTPEELSRLAGLREGALEVLAPAELSRFTPRGAVLRSGETERHEPLDAAYVLNGYLPDLTPLASWGLEWQGEYISAHAGQGTNLPGVFVAGDVASGHGDMKLIAAGFAEAAVAANHAVHFVRPDLKVRPGHSSDRRVSVHE